MDDGRRTTAERWSVVSGLWADFLTLMGMWLAVLLAFWLIGPAGRVLAGGDLFTYFYPYWTEAARALRAWRLPLWNPYLFMGVPFLANSQAGVFYPLNWPLWLLLPAHRALHWSIVLHLWLAATGAYVYGRTSLRLGQLGAITAALALALGGYLGAQVEHINQLQALAWFPWLLVLYHRAVLRTCRRPAPRLVSSVADVAGLAVAVAMVLLAGHTQSAFIVLVGLLAYALLAKAGADHPACPYRWRLVLMVAAVGWGAALAAAQLVPTLELMGYSVRAGGLPFNERVSFSLSPLYLARALLPGYVRPVEPEKIEFVATIGVSGLLLAGCCLPFVGCRSGSFERQRAEWDEGCRTLFLLAALGLFFSLGLYNPVYLLLARFVPGFAHFRAPARWLALWAFAGTMMTGVGVERVGRGAVRLKRRQWAVGVGAAALVIGWGILSRHTDLVTILAWIVTAVLGMGLVGIAQSGVTRAPCLRRWGAAVGLSALVVMELVVSARTLPRARATAPQAYTFLRPATAHLLAAGEGDRPPDRFLSLSALSFDPGDLAEMRIIYGPQLSGEALYDLAVAAKHREVLSPNLPLAFGVPAVDGYDGGVLPLARYHALQQAFLSEAEISLDGRLRENLTQVPDGRWLSLFNVRYLITDKVFDAWIDGVFYDLQFGARLSAGEAAAVAYVPPFEATALGLVSYLDGAGALADGVQVGEVAVGFADGSFRTFPLRAGIETAEGVYGPGVAHAQAPVGGAFWPGRPEGNDYVARLRWEDPATPVSVTVRAALPEGWLVVRGISLVDERTGSFQSLVLSDQGRFRRVHSGDVKVYENLDVLPRAFIAHRVWFAGGMEEALAHMRAADFAPTVEVVVEEQGGFVPGSPTGAGSDQVQVLEYTPERVEVAVDLAAPGYLVLTDAWYPGWRAWIDGEEVEVLAADLLFRAVALDAGRHRVVFTFRPSSLGVGAGVSLLAGIGLLFIWVYNRNWG